MTVGTSGAAPGQLPTPAQSPRRRWLWWVGAAVIVLALLGGWWLLQRNRGPAYGIAVNATAPALDFTLDATTGQPVSLSDFRDKVVLLYFGYTTCPDVCPTTLADLRMALAALGVDRDRVQVLFVSVDPERDTIDRMKTYLGYFDPGIIGLHGSISDIERIASRFGVIFTKRETPDSAADYLVDHTSAVLALDQTGTVREMFPYGVRGDQIASDVRTLIQ